MLVFRQFLTWSCVFVFWSSWPVTGRSSEIAPLSPHVELRMDYAGLRRLPQGVVSVVLGNPAIADVMLKGEDIIVFSAKSYGKTNLILLGANGEIIMETDLQVAPGKNVENRLVIYRGFERETYACSPECAAILQVGDANKYFDASMKQSQTRSSFILGNNGGSSRGEGDSSSAGGPPYYP